jgi:hypothetical protein
MTLLVIIVVCAILNPAAVGKFDGSVPPLCAPIEIVECEAAGKCYNSTAEDVDIPQFICASGDRLVPARGGRTAGVWRVAIAAANVESSHCI